MSGEWYERLNLSAISPEDRYRLLEYVVEKHGRRRVMGALGVSRYTVWRMLRRQVGVSDEKLRRILSLMAEEEFKKVMSTRGRLKALGIVREDGTVDHALIMEALSYAAGDEYLKRQIIGFVVRHFKEDLKKALGILPGAVTLKWTKGFEEYLTAKKKGRKVRSRDTLAHYRNLFKQHLEGRELTPSLVEEVASSNKIWLRTVFRHYVRYLHRNRRIGGETMGWILEVVPGRSESEDDVRAYRLDVRLFARTMEFLRERHEFYYLLYLLMYFSGVRLSHVLAMVANYRPDETVYVKMIEDYTARLVCFEADGFCRYYLGVGEVKPVHWVYFPLGLRGLLEKHAGTRRRRDTVSKYIMEKKLFPPKYLRKLNWRVAERIVGEAIARFIQSRLSELEVTKKFYGDLLTDADLHYPLLMKALERGLRDPDYLDVLLKKSKKQLVHTIATIVLGKTTADTEPDRQTRGLL